MGCLLLQRSKGVTEGESNRGEDGGQNGGSNEGGEGIRAGRRGRGERGRVGGRMNKRRAGDGYCEVTRERTIPWCFSVFSLYECMCVSVFCADINNTR